MKTLRRPKRYCFIEELQQSDIRDSQSIFDGIKDLVDEVKLEQYQALIRRAVTAKLRTAAGALTAGMQAAGELSQISVAGHCRVQIAPLQRLLDWAPHFDKDRPTRIPIFVRGDAVIYGSLDDEARLVVGRLAAGETEASPGLQAANDMLPDMRQDDLDARRDVFKLGRFWDCKGSSHSNYQSLVKSLVLQTILRRPQSTRNLYDTHESLTFCRYIRNTLTSLLLSLRGVSRTFAGSIMLRILSECASQTRRIAPSSSPRETDPEETHWRPINNEPIRINVIHTDSEDVAPAICASSGLEFTRYSAGAESAETSYLVTALYFIDPLKTIDSVTGVTMTVADALEVIGDQFGFILPQTLAEGCRDMPCGATSAEAILQRLWPPKIRSTDPDDLVTAVMQSGYNIMIRKRDDPDI